MLPAAWTIPTSSGEPGCGGIVGHAFLLVSTTWHQVWRELSALAPGILRQTPAQQAVGGEQLLRKCCKARRQ